MGWVCFTRRRTQSLRFSCFRIRIRHTMAKRQGQMMFVDGEHKPYIEESTEETIMTWTMMDEEEDRLLCFAMKMFI
ncbi:unnamed protein product [Brassica oleracea]